LRLGCLLCSCVKYEFNFSYAWYIRWYFLFMWSFNNLFWKMMQYSCAFLLLPPKTEMQLFWQPLAIWRGTCRCSLLCTCSCCVQGLFTAQLNKLWSVLLDVSNCLAEKSEIMLLGLLFFTTCELREVVCKGSVPAVPTEARRKIPSGIISTEICVVSYSDQDEGLF